MLVKVGKQTFLFKDKATNQTCRLNANYVGDAPDWLKTNRLFISNLQSESNPNGMISMPSSASIESKDAELASMKEQIEAYKKNLEEKVALPNLSGEATEPALTE